MILNRRQLFASWLRGGEGSILILVQGLVKLDRNGFLRVLMPDSALRLDGLRLLHVPARHLTDYLQPCVNLLNR